MRTEKGNVAFLETALTRARVEAHTAAGWWPRRLLNECLDEAVARHPEKTALLDPHGRYTYRELRELADRAALGFLELGIRKGDVVTVQLPNWKEFVVVTLALERIGAVISPLAPIFREREVRSMLRLGQPRAVVSAATFRGFKYSEMYAELQREFPEIRSLIVVGAGETRVGMRWEELLELGGKAERHRSALGWLHPSANDVVELMFTSGTTGEPKGVLHTPNTLAANIETAISVCGLTGDDVCHMASTLAHQTGFLYGANLPIRLGACGVYQDVWDAARFVELVEQEGITFTMGATPFLADTLRVPNIEARDLRSFRVFLCGGAAIPEPVAEEAARRLPCRLAPLWGMTEVGISTLVFREDPLVQVTKSDGRAVPGMEVIVRDADGRPALPGMEGDLCARGPGVFIGYIQGRTFTEQFFDADGWFATGDRARMNAEGFIRITGRSKDLIIRGGENVPVKEIEDMLLRHPKVRNVALVGTPHPRLGEIGCACVIPEEGQTITLNELQEFLAREKVTRQFWPERLELVTEFPTTPAGKVQKFRLRDLVAARLAPPSPRVT